MDMSCVLVMKNDSLMKRALAGVLQVAGDQLNVCVSEADKVSELSAEIIRLDAGVVLLGESMPLAEDTAVMQLLATHARLRVIVVSEQSNWLHIFCKEDRLLAGLPELLNIICAD